MLTLVKSADAIPIVGIYRGKKNKKPDATVYFTHQISEENQNIAPAAGVLHLHKNDVKKDLHLNEADYKEVCRMIDASEEPDQGDPLRHAYWSVLEQYDRFLKREMYIGDDKQSRFEINLPRDRETWPGTMTCIASSGGGKTRFVVEMILRYLKSVEPHNRRPVIWLSPELTIDKSLKPLRDKRKWDMWFHGIDISEQELKKKGWTGRRSSRRRFWRSWTASGRTRLWCSTTSPTGPARCTPSLSGSTTRCCACRGTGTWASSP